jgi:hypothetical protein
VEGGPLLEASLGGQEEGMMCVDYSSPERFKDVLKLVFGLQYDMSVGAGELADVLIMFLGKDFQSGGQGPPPPRYCSQ